MTLKQERLNFVIKFTVPSLAINAKAKVNYSLILVTF